jgi:hypothetical protein
MRQAVMVEYIGRPAALAEALQHADERTLYWIFYGIRGEDYCDDALPLPDWVEFRDTLLEGMRQSPRVMLRVMAPLVTTATGPKSTPWMFDESRASLLFTDLDLLLLLFGQCIGDGCSERVTAVANYGAQRRNAAILTARQELEDRLTARVRELELASSADDVDG